MLSRSLKLGFGLLCALVLAQAATAAPITRDINTASGTPSNHTGTFGTVELTQVSTTEVLVTVNVTSSISGSTAVFGFNEPSVTLTSSEFSNFTSNFSFGSTGVPETPFGTFGYTINCSHCSGGSGPSTLSFDITVASGLSISQFTSDGTGTNDYFDFAETKSDGLVAAFPEPPTYALFATSLAGLFFLRRRTLRPARISRRR